MLITPISTFNNSRNKKHCTFSSTTVFHDQKIVEENLLTLSQDKDIFKNIRNESQNILGIKLRRDDSENINIVSRYDHRIGNINFDKNASQPKINLQMGSFQPMIELKDEELGITILMTRGSKLSGKNLSINYKELTKPTVSFGHKLVVTTGYKGSELKTITNKYFDEKYEDKDSKLKQDYTIVGLGGGYGTRLKPISDLYDANKPTTKYPGESKTLFEVAVLDTVNGLGGISDVQYINEPENNISGTAGTIIKGLKSGIIDRNKPLVLITGDIYHDIDIKKALEMYEKDPNCGIAMLVKEVKQEDMVEKSLVKLSNDYPVRTEGSYEIEDLSPVISPDNFHIRGSYVTNTQNGEKYYTSTNITIIHPKILEYLEQFADRDGKADFLQFLGFMFNAMNKPFENLHEKYCDSFPSCGLDLEEMVDIDGEPNSIYSDDCNELQVKAIIAKDKENENPSWEDVGTVESYLKVVHSIKDDSTKFSNFRRAIKNNVDANGVVYMNETAQEKLDLFKKKYNIENLSGNIIVYAKNEKENNYPALDDKHSQILLKKLSNPKEAKQYVKALIKQHGMTNFINWYLNTYYKDYEKFLDNYFEQATSIEELLKFQPNWAPWKLEEKKWLLENPQFKNHTFEQKRSYLNSYWDSIREIPFEFGSVPSGFGDKETYRYLINKLKTNDIKNEYLTIGSRSFDLKRLKGGEYNNKFVYLVETEDSKKYILKFERINVEDADYLDYRNLSMFEKKAIRKEKYLASDSVYSNACIGKYLELNGCPNVPKLHYYDHKTHSSISEYIDDIKGDEFQKDIIDEEYMSLDEMNKAFKSLNNLGIFLNDAAYKNILTDENGIAKIIDLGHSNFIHPLKPGVKRFNIEFANTNGPDLRSIYAGFLLSLMNN